MGGWPDGRVAVGQRLCSKVGVWVGRPMCKWVQPNPTRAFFPHGTHVHLLFLQVWHWPGLGPLPTHAAARRRRLRRSSSAAACSAKQNTQAAPERQSRAGGSAAGRGGADLLLVQADGLAAVTGGGGCGQCQQCAGGSRVPQSVARARCAERRWPAGGHLPLWWWHPHSFTDLATCGLAPSHLQRDQKKNQKCQTGLHGSEMQSRAAGQTGDGAD